MAKKNELDYEITEGDVFTALGKKNADELLARSQLLDRVSSLIQNSGLSQQEVAKRLGITQPKVSKFSTDALLHYLSILGCEVEIRVKKPRSRIGIFKRKGCIAVC
jgi:predicted XRE-type DNA-binding protein